MITSLQIPIEFAEKARREYELAKARRNRYEKKTQRGRHDANESRDGGHKRDVHYRDYRFVAWDGEAPKDTGYSLFGNSDGLEICKPELGTEECLDLLLESRKSDPLTINVWFGGRYDWDEILRKCIPFRYLSRLKTHGVVRWKGYRLTECEGKIYTVSKDGVEARIFEIHGWFHKRYVAALRDYGIGTEAELDLLESEKNRRSEFLWEEIAEIRDYMRLELKLMPRLMDKIRDICLAAGFDPHGWYGPSALAKQLLTRHKIKQYMAECPEAVNKAACYAFAGGRFEPFRGGIAEQNSTIDQNSAYMHAALDLPSLAHGTWRCGKDYEPGKFALYHIRYKSTEPYDALRPYPLFRRLKNGSVCWPRRTEGWYWNPEAELVKDDPGAEFIEAWIFDEDRPGLRPFSFVRDVYDRRLLLKRLPVTNPSRQAEIAFKWALAAIYGQCARRVGWDRKKRRAPACHQLEWAGYITSKCRAEMYKKAIACGDRLCSIDTDSVTYFGTLEWDNLGDELGQWKVEVSDEGVFFQSGVFFTKQEGAWSKGKSRGIEQRRKTPDLTPDMLLQAILTDSALRLTPKRRYTTVKMALNGMCSSAGQWKDSEGNTLVFGGGGKRYHNKMMCWKYCNGNIHGFIPVFSADRNIFDLMSYPHELPWKVKEVKHDYSFTDVLWFDDESQDDDQQWLIELVRQRVA